MAARFSHKHWPVGVLALGAAYACSGNPEVVIRPTDVGQGGNAASAGSGGTGGSSANGGRAGSSAGTIGTSGGTGGKAGAGGKSGNTGGKGGASSGGTAGDIGTGAFGGFPDIDFDYDAGMMGTGGACDQVVDKGTLVKRPMDIIISIDNSGSMEGEIQAVIDNINTDFAAIIQASGIDYRVIMVSRYGYLTYAPNPTNFSVCIGPPLGNEACTNNSAPTLVNTMRFFHHSTDIGSNNMWCRLLTAYNTQDEIPNQRMGWTDVAPNGWQDWLRPEAFKVFIGITDDNPTTAGGQNTQGCPNTPYNNTLAGAQAWDQALRTLGPTQFGAYDAMAPDMGRNYRWYSIIGMIPKAGMETTPYEPTEPVVNGICMGDDPDPMEDADDGVGAGLGYQELSRMTGGLRYSNCLNDDFDAIFNAIAQGVIEGSRASCEYDVPTPTGGIVDFDQTEVSYLPGGNAAGAIDLTRAATDMDCTNNPGFYFNQDFSKIFLCPNTCVTVQQDDMAEVQLDFGCLGS